jgi:hypothetical protein
MFNSEQIEILIKIKDQHQKQYFTLKMEVARFSEALVVYPTFPQHNSENRDHILSPKN